MQLYPGGAEGRRKNVHLVFITSQNRTTRHAPFNMSIYRAHEDQEADTFREAKDQDTRRPPSNVPYVVDNLWEWARPEAYPDRRRSKFASPNYEQALRSRGLPTSQVQSVFRLEFVGDPAVAQLSVRDEEGRLVRDAKNHPDCKRLRKLLIGKLDGERDRFFWPSQPMEEKYPASQLFQPCLTAEEVDHLFDTVEVLQPHKDEIRRRITYWDDLELVDADSLYNQEGEVLFQFKDPGEEEGFWLRPVETGS